MAPERGRLKLMAGKVTPEGAGVSKERIGVTGIEIAGSRKTAR